MIDATVCNLLGQLKIVLIEQGEVLRERYVAGTNFSFFVGYNGIYGYAVELYKFATDGKQINSLMRQAALPIQ